MFTGLINHVATICEFAKASRSVRIGIQHQFADIQLGESIAVNGICLSVNDLANGIFYCDISPETLQLTTARYFKKGTAVNLEQSLRLCDRLGGHFVTGHVDQVLYVSAIQNTEQFVALEFSGVTSDTKKWLVKKGSVAVNGVSLTVNELTANGLQVMLIPHTLQNTNLSLLKVGDKVNVEYDLLAKLVAKQVDYREQDEVSAIDAALYSI